MYLIEKFESLKKTNTDFFAFYSPHYSYAKTISMLISKLKLKNMVYSRNGRMIILAYNNNLIKINCNSQFVYELAKSISYTLKCEIYLSLNNQDCLICDGKETSPTDEYLQTIFDTKRIIDVRAYSYITKEDYSNIRELIIKNKNIGFRLVLEEQLKSSSKNLNKRILTKMLSI